jgi:hypothetical protein
MNLTEYARRPEPERELIRSGLRDGVVAPSAAAAGERLAVELVVGLPEAVSLVGGGRDLDNYLFPIAQRLGAARLAAVFGRKVHGTSLVALGAATSAAVDSPPQFTTRMVGSYVKSGWKHQLRAKLEQAGVEPAPPGPVADGCRGHDWAKAKLGQRVEAAAGLLWTRARRGPGPPVQPRR